MSDRPRDLAAPDLTEQALAPVLGERPVRSYPALLTTEAVAMAWAREGAAGGALVVADYQAAPRGRGGFPWVVRAGSGLGFTLLARPELPPEREGWPYVPALLGLHDVLGGSDSALHWPDTVSAGDDTALARLGVATHVGSTRTEWVSMTVLVEQAQPPRAGLLRELVDAVERRLSSPVEQVLEDYRPRCATLGRQHTARLIPLGPAGPQVTGEAVDVLADGALVLRTERGARVAVPPQNLGLLEPPHGPVEPPARLLGHLPPR
jgi:BirA family biotin operon repressor/biotin-[acetyl-CoA-carboxylase] ligase